jgi:hypothetical protein
VKYIIILLYYLLNANVYNVVICTKVDLLVTTVVDGITIFNWNETKESIISNTYQATIAPVGSRSFQLMYGSSLDKFVPYNNRVCTSMLPVNFDYDSVLSNVLVS